MSDIGLKLIEQLDREKRSVSFDSYDITVRQLVDMAGQDQIEIAPDYQRHFIWDEKRESALIESIFLGIPVPSLFMATNSDSTWEVVDGVQRLSTLMHFVANESVLSKIRRDKPLALEGLTKLTALNDLCFSELPNSVQLNFMLRPLKVTTLNDRSDLDVRYELFERLNTGGVKLHDQEIRNCVFRGKLRDQLKELAANSDFRAAVIIRTSEEAEAMREECVLRFFAFLDRYDSFGHLVNRFLADYSKDMDKKGLSKVKLKTFEHTMKFIADELPNGITRGGGTTPLNLYEAVAVGSALLFENGKMPTRNKLASLLTDPDLQKKTQGGTNTRNMVKGRIEFVRDALS